MRIFTLSFTYSANGDPIYTEEAEFKRAMEDKNIDKMETFLVRIVGNKEMI